MGYVKFRHDSVGKSEDAGRSCASERGWLGGTGESASDKTALWWLVLQRTSGIVDVGCVMTVLQGSAFAD